MHTALIHTKHTKHTGQARFGRIKSVLFFNLIAVAGCRPKCKDARKSLEQHAPSDRVIKRAVPVVTGSENLKGDHELPPSVFNSPPLGFSAFETAT